VRVRFYLFADDDGGSLLSYHRRGATTMSRLPSAHQRASVPYYRFS